MTRYAIMKRRKGERSSRTDGYYSYDFDYMVSQAKDLAGTGEYSMVKIGDADTNRTVETFTKSRQ